MSVQTFVGLVMYGQPCDPNQVCITRIAPDRFLYTEWYSGDEFEAEGHFDSKIINKEDFVAMMTLWDDSDILQGNNLKILLGILDLPS